MKFTLSTFALVLILSSPLSAQYKVDGVIRDAADNSPLTGAVIKLVLKSDSARLTGTVAGETGSFEIINVQPGTYLLQINYIGYTIREQEVSVSNTDVHLGSFQLRKKANDLKEVEVVETQVRVEQKADTSEYNANAFKTNKDASAEDLVTKMPGIVSENGTIKAQGETLQKVLIDGKEYFGDDASLALKNVPAEVVDRVQVFDRMSDQSNFTGFDDGNSQKAMNIVTKNGMNNGVFGKLYAGYGYINESRYTAGGSLNWFKDNRRISLIGMSNNINQQNFSMQDLLGATGAQSRGPGGPGGGFVRHGGGRGGSGGWMGNSALNNFMVGQQGGISTTHAAGFNYIDVWGKKKNFKITGSYFYNLSNNTNTTETNRTYFNTGDSAVFYKELNTSTGSNSNHRVNLRMEYSIDTNNILTFTPKFSYQQNSQTNNILGQNGITGGDFLSSTSSNYKTNSAGYNAAGDLLYQHRFNKRYRTISFNIGTNINNRWGNTSQLALNSFADSGDSASIDQQANSSTYSYKAYGSINYTEPAGKTGMIQLSYEPSYTWNIADKQTFNRDTVSDAYSLRDTALSNKYDNDYMTQKGGASYRVKGEKFNAMVGVNFQYALLTGVSEFPFTASVHRDFYNVLPTATFNYKFSAASSLRLMYRTSTDPPSISQLQNVIDNSNPLLLSAGNPDLKQTYRHFAMLRYNFTNTKKAQTFFAFASVNYTQNYIGNSTIIATEDTMLNEFVVLRAGSQLTKPVNINGSLNVNSFLTYGLPLKKIKSNINFNAGVTYTRNPSLINTLQNWSNTYGVNGGVVLSSNISEKIDFSINYFANYNIVKNTLQTNSDNNYFKHNGGVRFNWQFWKGFVFTTDMQNTLYAGIADGFNQNIFIWNAGLGYKFLKNQSLEVRASVNDILNQNNGISRNVTETYVEDTQTQVLKRFWLLTITYTPRFFAKKDATK